ncbi:hypothetical protein K1719_015025 [Acacia pycnantha]|nr:hypothetical protein K1719_015025 [Acacia pycnantha]
MPMFRYDLASSLKDKVQDTISGQRNEMFSLLSRYVTQGKGILRPHNLLGELEKFPKRMKHCKDSKIALSSKCSNLQRKLLFCPLSFI